ncbi:DUF2489 domain-containing protein [Halomonas borealis]|jgi:hypothetical protein|uniref:DUF2489 domain-containing protein n=1 Tax=Halomonas borealis TaxID=2508710 RepID=UPI0010A00254|nr:DUF2489 domain-containing protein [Halomonas borealis]
MSLITALILLGIALAVVAGLGAYAVTLWREVRRRRSSREEEERRAHDNCLDNLELVAAALQQRQVDVTEGAWRCKTLLDILDPGLVERPEFRAIGEVHGRTRHLHTHSARQALTPKARFEEDRERLAVEDEMGEAVIEASGAVLRWCRDRSTSSQ